MAVENLQDRAFLNNKHVQAFTVSDGASGFEDLTGDHVKWSMSPISASTGAFDPAVISLQKTNQTLGHMTDVDLANGQIDVNIDPADTSGLTAGEYHFQLEVFDSSGLNGVVVASGVLTLLANNVETA